VAGFGEANAIAVKDHGIVAAFFDNGFASIGEGFEIRRLGLVDGVAEDGGKMHRCGVEELDGIGIPGGIFLADGFVGLDESLAIEFDRFAIVIVLSVGVALGGDIGPRESGGEEKDDQGNTGTPDRCHGTSLENGRGIVIGGGGWGQHVYSCFFARLEIVGYIGVCISRLWVCFLTGRVAKKGLQGKLEGSACRVAV
jgi:hypothetical protein